MDYNTYTLLVSLTLAVIFSASWCVWVSVCEILALPSPLSHTIDYTPEDTVILPTLISRSVTRTIV